MKTITGLIVSLVIAGSTLAAQTQETSRSRRWCRKTLQAFPAASS